MLMNLVNFLPTAGQSIKFDYVSIVLIVILVIGLIYGVFKGFLKTALSIVVYIGSIVIAVFVTNPLANWLKTLPMKESINSGVYNWLNTGHEEAFQMVLTMENKDTIIPEALKAFGLPEALSSIINPFINGNIPSEGIQVGEFITTTITNYILMAIAFVIVWLVSFIILLIVKMLIKKILKVKAINVIDKLLGVVTGLALSICICLVASYGLACVINLNENVYNYFKDVMYLEDDNVYTISKMLYENNYLQQLINMFANK